MAARKRRLAAAADGGTKNGVSAADKIARLLALLVTREMVTDDAALKLDAIGFEAREISMLLDVGPNYVNVARHRKAVGRKKARKRLMPHGDDQSGTPEAAGR
jgi:hypothetical protein